ncbi:enoyl-CoA hydratase/isomerase family protein [Alteromonas lipolytica]|uniref:Gamma-carboxygeranoyl-CoA hydratase n=1 Tax=Alteromonas lipolytica TaxID=1856405 RepID=A0A1E8FIM3_9ALTE|nr:enoyl-CoA hydratase/isomerase family protein [Alteromonas lipolytica]OFI35769.1 gamma-carboxygeranoyl-CoA hydratase [Alteromonas lipolytica]GGF80621.1 enoyl-CoA hydratase [Alteromonas lipolytica]
MTEYVLYEVDERGVARITLNRADKHNAFNETMIAGLTASFTRAAEDSNVKVVILAANGKNFSAGADLNWMKKMAGYSEAENRADAMHLATMLHTLHTLPKPTIARVQGAAFAGAIGLIACCDMAVACKLSKFCLSETKIGLVPATISPYVIEAMGKRIAKRYFMTAEVFTARRARRLGLISETVSEDQLDATIEQLIEALLKNSPNAISEAKALVDTVAGQPLDESMRRLTSDWIARMRVSEQGQEGLSAFLDKRSPGWVKE